MTTKQLLAQARRTEKAAHKLLDMALTTALAENEQVYNLNQNAADAKWLVQCCTLVIRGIKDRHNIA